MVNYENNLEKREIQKRMFPLIKKKKMVTLGGPNLCDYLTTIPKQIKAIDVYEKDKNIMVIQMSEVDKLTKNISYYFKDIIYTEVDRKNTFYDLDFCCSIKGAERYIRKFKDCAYSLTLSLRPYTAEQTMEKFFGICDERVKLNIPHPNYNLVKTNKGSYIYTTYFDIWPMITIFKFH